MWPAIHIDYLTLLKDSCTLLHVMYKVSHITICKQHFEDNYLELHG